MSAVGKPASNDIVLTLLVGLNCAFSAGNRHTVGERSFSSYFATGIISKHVNSAWLEPRTRSEGITNIEQQACTSTLTRLMQAQTSKFTWLPSKRTTCVTYLSLTEFQYNRHWLKSRRVPFFRLYHRIFLPARVASEQHALPTEIVTALGPSVHPVARNDTVRWCARWHDFHGYFGAQTSPRQITLSPRRETHLRAAH